MDWYEGPEGQRRAMAAAIAQSSLDLRQTWDMPSDGPTLEVNVDGVNPYAREQLGIAPDADRIWVPQTGGDPSRNSIFGPPLSVIFGQENVAPVAASTEAHSWATWKPPEASGESQAAGSQEPGITGGTWA